jgi:DNA-binding FrmR family transcriptional regulator
MRIEDDKKIKSLVVRLAKVEGQLRGVSKMIEEKEDCTKIAEQLSATRAALSAMLASFTVCAFEEAEHPYNHNHNASIAKIVKIIS